jgi:hypothetical protein
MNEGSPKQSFCARMCHRADRLGLNNKIKGDQDIGPWSNIDYVATR